MHNTFSVMIMNPALKSRTCWTSPSVKGSLVDTWNIISLCLKTVKTDSDPVCPWDTSSPPRNLSAHQNTRVMFSVCLQPPVIAFHFMYFKCQFLYMLCQCHTNLTQPCRVAKCQLQFKASLKPFFIAHWNQHWPLSTKALESHCPFNLTYSSASSSCMALYHLLRHLRSLVQPL